MSVALSPAMVDALALADANGGRLVRYHGGYWAPATGPHPADGGPWCHAIIISALVQDGRMIFTQSMPGRPVVAEVVREAGIFEHPATLAAMDSPKAIW